MRHHRAHRKLSRTAEHRKALMRRLVTSLFEHERIETTVAKAKEARRVAERMITYAKRDNLHSRRLVARVVQDETIVKKLFDTIRPWYTTREGGYTRILKTRRRLGDAGEMAILELVKTPEQRAADVKRRAEKAVERAKAKAKAREERALPGGLPAPEAPEKEEAPAKAEKAAKTEETAEKPKKKTTTRAGKTPKPDVTKRKEAPAKSPKKGGGLLSRIRKRKTDA